MIQPCVYGVVFFAGMCGDECLRVNEAQPKTVPSPSNLYCAVSARPTPSPLAHLERYDFLLYVYAHQHGKRAGEREGGCGPVVFYVTEMHNVRHHHRSHCLYKTCSTAAAPTNHQQLFPFFLWPFFCPHWVPSLSFFVYLSCRHLSALR